MATEVTITRTFPLKVTGMFLGRWQTSDSINRTRPKKSYFAERGQITVFVELFFVTGL